MKQIADIFEQIFNKPELKGFLDEGKVLSTWPQIVGVQIAQLSKPLSFKDGTLFVRVDSPAWRNELSMMRSHIKKKINESLGSEIVQSIILR